MLLRKYLDDLFVILGCALIISATAILSWLAALYVTGGMLILAGIVIGIAEKRGPK